MSNKDEDKETITISRLIAKEWLKNQGLGGDRAKWWLIYEMRRARVNGVRGK